MRAKSKVYVKRCAGVLVAVCVAYTLGSVFAAQVRQVISMGTLECELWLDAGEVSGTCSLTKPAKASEE